MATTQTVNIDINANTKDAEKQVSNLENNIKTLDGAINLVGGSIEVLAGGLALAGAVTEEQAERFQTAAVGAIALADGSKRLLEGYKTLADGTKVAATAQRIYNNVVKANPYVAAAVAVAALTAAIVLIVKRTREANIEEQKANGIRFTTEQNTLKAAEAQNAYNRSLESQEAELENSIKLLKAQGGSIDDVFEAEKRLLELRIAARRDEANELQRQIDNISDAIQQFIELGVTGPALNKLKEEKQGLLNEVNGIVNNIKLLETDLQILQLDYIKELDEAEEDSYKEFEKRELQRREELKKTTQARIAADVARAKSEKEAADAAIEAERKAQEFKEMAIQGGIDNIQGALGALFAENKAVASANVLIDAAQAGVGIIKNSQTTGPLAIAYQVSQFALLAATTAASLKQINSAEPDSTGVPNTPGKGVPLSSFGVGTSTIAGATGTVAPTLSQQPPMRAYVLATDVRTELEAGALLQTRRQFP